MHVQIARVMILERCFLWPLHYAALHRGRDRTTSWEVGVSRLADKIPRAQSAAFTSSATRLPDSSAPCIQPSIQTDVCSAAK
jgi:hypothetical protein